MGIQQLEEEKNKQASNPFAAFLPDSAKAIILEEEGAPKPVPSEEDIKDEEEDDEDDELEHFGHLDVEGHDAKQVYEMLHSIESEKKRKRWNSSI